MVRLQLREQMRRQLNAALLIANDEAADLLVGGLGRCRAALVPAVPYQLRVARDAHQAFLALLHLDAQLSLAPQEFRAFLAEVIVQFESRDEQRAQHDERAEHDASAVQQPVLVALDPSGFESRPARRHAVRQQVLQFSWHVMSARLTRSPA